MRIYIATWGDPKNWRYAEYRYNDSSVRGFSTLNLVLASGKLKPSQVLIFTLDTLAYEVPGRKVYRDYGDLVTSVKGYIGNYLCAEGNVAVEVLPGVMRREGKAEFRGNLDDTRLLALYYVYFHSVGGARRGERGSPRVLLDTTHGINYLITLVSEVVREASAALSTALAEPVTLQVYNADPIPPGSGLPRSATNPCIPVQQGDGVPPALRYNLLRRDVVKPWDLVKYLRYDGNRVKKVVSDERSCDIDQNEKQSALEIARRLVAAFRVGTVAELAVIASSNRGWVETAESLTRRAVECWLRKAEVLDESGVVKTGFNAKLMDGFRLLIHAHAVYTGVESVLKNTGTGPERVRECYAEPGNVSLECIEKLEENLLKGSEVTRTLVSHEIGVLKSRLHKGVVPDVWTPYAKILGEGRVGADGEEAVRVSCDDVDKLEPQELEKLKRHFIAHAGFLKDVLEVKREDNRVLVRIREGCAELVNKVLDKVFEDLLT